MSKYQSSNIYEISLADALEFVVDNRGKTVPTDDKGIALIATNCISNDHIYPQKQNLRYVSQDIFDNWFRAHPKPGDIILTNKGSNNGEVCLVPNTVDFCIAQDMVAVRADKKKIDPLYLFAALRSRIVQKRIKYLNVDAVIPHFKKTDFNKLLIPLPDRKSQEFIGKIYFNFSIKIDNLRRQNETLEKIAQTLFKHWFIDFEFPNDDGKPYKSSGGAMVASELGDIPTGWRVERLGDLTQTITKGTTPTTFKKDFVASGINFIKAESITENHTLEKSKFAYIDEDTNLFLKRSIVQEKDILYTIAGTIGRYAMITSSSLPANTNQAVAIIRPDFKKIDPEYLLCYFASINYWHYLSSRIVQAVQANLSLGVLSDSPITIPDQRIKNIFSELIIPIFAKKEFNQQQIQTLTKTRDTLLPKLMSGQIRVKEGESLIEEVK